MLNKFCVCGNFSRRKDFLRRRRKNTYSFVRKLLNTTSEKVLGIE